MTKTTIHKAPDHETGYSAGDLARILANHHPAAEVFFTVAWPRRILRIEITEPESANACVTGPTPGNNHPDSW